MKRPVPPTDHPMASYAEYMLDQMDLLMLFGGITIAAITVLAVAFAFFAVQKFWERAELRLLNSNVVKMTTTCASLVATVEGWTVIHVQEESDRREAVAKAADDLKQTLPPVVADKVVEKLEASASLSGTMKTPPLPGSSATAAGT